MGGVEKGLQPFGNSTLVGHALERLQEQACEVWVSANRHMDQYLALGCRVIPDKIAGHPGPLAGLHAGLTQISTEWLVCVPCDAPWFPEDLVVRLAGAAAGGGCLAAVACSPAVDGSAVLQPTFCLVHRTLRTSIEAFLHTGQHKAGLWLDSVAAARVVFAPSGHVDPFANLNTLEELAKARKS